MNKQEIGEFAMSFLDDLDKIENVVEEEVDILNAMLIVNTKQHGVLMRSTRTTYTFASILLATVLRDITTRAHIYTQTLETQLNMEGGGHGNEPTGI